MLANRYKFQLTDRAIGHQPGPAIIGAGGVVLVCPAGSPLKGTIQNRAGTVLANPLALTRGGAEFYSGDAAVDLFILAPDGQFVTLWSVGPDEINEVAVDRDRVDQMMVIPLHITNYPATVETDTGFDCPANAVFLADSCGTGMRITAIDATETVDVGTATAETGDPNGFLAALAVGVLGVILTPQGALLTTLLGHASGSKSIVITTTAGSDTVQGYVHLAYKLLPLNQPIVTMS